MRCSTRQPRRSTRRAGRRRLAEVQRIARARVPYISLWHKTNVAIAQRTLTGIHLSPMADFHFLKMWRARSH